MTLLTLLDMCLHKRIIHAISGYLLLINENLLQAGINAGYSGGRKYWGWDRIPEGDEFSQYDRKSSLFSRVFTGIVPIFPEHGS